MIIIVVVLFAVLIGIFCPSVTFLSSFVPSAKNSAGKKHHFQMTWCAFCVFHAYLRFGLFVYKQKAKQMLRYIICKQI